jgi:hypothetical protein
MRNLTTIRTEARRKDISIIAHWAGYLQLGSAGLAEAFSRLVFGTAFGAAYQAVSILDLVLVLAETPDSAERGTAGTES